jgi:hypothetical protein
MVEMNKAFVVSDGIEQLAIQMMGVNKVLATMARKKMCVLLVVMMKGCSHNLC